LSGQVAVVSRQALDQLQEEISTGGLILEKAFRQFIKMSRDLLPLDRFFLQGREVAIEIELRSAEIAAANMSVDL